MNVSFVCGPLISTTDQLTCFSKHLDWLDVIFFWKVIQNFTFGPMSTPHTLRYARFMSQVSIHKIGHRSRISKISERIFVDNFDSRSKIVSRIVRTFLKLNF